MDIARLGRDVEIARRQQAPVLLQFAMQPVVQGGNPFELVGILFGADRLAVRNIGAYDADAVDGGCDQPALLVIDSRQLGLDVCDLVHGVLPEQNGHAVVRFLPGKKAAVAGRGQRRHRKILIDELGFLQADDVDRLALQPLQQVAEADVQ